MHVHQSLWRDGDNVFHDPDGWERASRACRWYAGGLLRRARALCALCAPTPGSYRRLSAETGAPTKLLLSSSDEGALCRIPHRSPAPAARRLKFRLADPSANPHLALAGILLAGLDGVRRRLEPPLDGAPASALPRTVEEALDALQAEREFLLAGGLRPALLDAYVEELRTGTAPSPAGASRV